MGFLSGAFHDSAHHRDGMDCRNLTIARESKQKIWKQRSVVQFQGCSLKHGKAFMFAERQCKELLYVAKGSSATLVGISKSSSEIGFVCRCKYEQKKQNIYYTYILTV